MFAVISGPESGGEHVQSFSQTPKSTLCKLCYILQQQNFEHIRLREAYGTRS